MKDVGTPRMRRREVSNVFWLKLDTKKGRKKERKEGRKKVKQERKQEMEKNRMD
jgi:hypothetical protein